MMEDKKKRISKRIDYLPSVFFQKERISKFIKEMNHYSAKDIIKLRRMIYDYYGSLKYYIKKQKIDVEDYESLRKELENLDVFKNDNYIDKLIEMFSEATNIAGICGLLPDYRAGEPIPVAGD